MSASRTQRSWLKPSQVLALSATLRELWSREPHLTTDQVIAMTDAPRSVVENVRRRLVKAGVPLNHQRSA